MITTSPFFSWVLLLVHFPQARISGRYSFDHRNFGSVDIEGVRVKINTKNDYNFQL